MDPVDIRGIVSLIFPAHPNCSDALFTALVQFNYTPLDFARAKVIDALKWLGGSQIIERQTKSRCPGAFTKTILMHWIAAAPSQ
jgi:hypothetical protein